MTPYFETSIGRDRMCDDMSATSGTPPVSGVKATSARSEVATRESCQVNRLSCGIAT